MFVLYLPFKLLRGPLNHMFYWGVWRVPYLWTALEGDSADRQPSDPHPRLHVFRCFRCLVYLDVGYWLYVPKQYRIHLGKALKGSNGQ